MRETWANQKEFLLACIGYCVGLGNLWRFPYLVYESGGASFLVPYFIMLILVGIPLLYMELSIGVITQRGPVLAFKAMCPLLKGIGYATVVLSFLYSAYFTTIIAYVLFYLTEAFNQILPWSSCNATWATENCADSNGYNGSISVTQEYFDHHVLHKSNSITEFGFIQPQLLLTLFVTWVIIYFFVFKGTKIIGKVVYFTAITPYLMLFALAIRGCTLSGAQNGVDYFLGLNGKGDWSRIYDIQVWVNATSQIFNSIGIGFGTLINFSSFNNNHKTILRDTILIATVNSATSILAGFIIFSVLGHISEITGIAIPDLKTDGLELVFISYPQALSSMQPTLLWSILFFFSLFLLGIDSVFSSVEVVNQTIIDRMNTKKFGRETVAFVVCLVLFFLTIPNMYSGGIYLYKLLDWYTCVQSVAIIGALEVVTVLWFFGARNLSKELEKSSGVKTLKVIEYVWMAVTPVLVIIIMCFSIIGYKRIEYGSYVYPDWCEWFGWCVATLSVICIPVAAIHELSCRITKRSDVFSMEMFREVLVTSLRPDKHRFYGSISKCDLDTHTLIKPHSNQESDSSLSQVSKLDI